MWNVFTWLRNYLQLLWEIALDGEEALVGYVGYRRRRLRRTIMMAIFMPVILLVAGCAIGAVSSGWKAGFIALSMVILFVQTALIVWREAAVGIALGIAFEGIARDTFATLGWRAGVAGGFRNYLSAAGAIFVSEIAIGFYAIVLPVHEDPTVAILIAMAGICLGITGLLLGEPIVWLKFLKYTFSVALLLLPLLFLPAVQKRVGSTGGVVNGIAENLFQHAESLPGLITNFFANPFPEVSLEVVAKALILLLLAWALGSGVVAAFRKKSIAVLFWRLVAVLVLIGVFSLLKAPAAAMFRGTIDSTPAAGSRLSTAPIAVNPAFTGLVKVPGADAISRHQTMEPTIVKRLGPDQWEVSVDGTNEYTRVFPVQGHRTGIMVKPGQLVVIRHQHGIPVINEYGQKMRSLCGMRRALYESEKFRFYPEVGLYAMTVGPAVLGKLLESPVSWPCDRDELRLQNEGTIDSELVFFYHLPDEHLDISNTRRVGDAFNYAGWDGSRAVFTVELRPGTAPASSAAVTE